MSELLFPEGLSEYWEEHWVNMPEFSHENLQPKFQIIVSFATSEEIAEFSSVVNQKITESTRSVWFKQQQIWTYSDKSYE
jgi:hypothetical protein